MSNPYLSDCLGCSAAALADYQDQAPSADPDYRTTLGDGGILPIAGTVGTIINAVLGVGVIVGTIGGILYLRRSGTLPFRRKKR